MPVTPALILGGVSLALLLLGGIANARRGIGRWSLIPWDYIMLLAAVSLVASLALLADAWRRTL
ncbi:MAG: hypothetical protein WCZ66_04710 [Sphingomonadaceae bacterium]